MASRLPTRTLVSSSESRPPVSGGSPVAARAGAANAMSTRMTRNRIKYFYTGTTSDADVGANVRRGMAGKAGVASSPQIWPSCTRVDMSPQTLPPREPPRR
jgi:hypothetical protein